MPGVWRGRAVKVYVAGPLFTDAERPFNLQLAAALAARGHQVYLPQRDSPEPTGAGGTASTFGANVRAIQDADALVAVCDGLQVDDGTAWEVGYAFARGIRVFGLRTDRRTPQQADEPVNLMILESLAELLPSVGRVARGSRRPRPPGCWVGAVGS